LIPRVELPDEPMKATRALTNSHQDFQVLNLSEILHRAEGRGPYLVTQDGCDPNDPTMRQCSFVLTKRGTWFHFYLYLALPEAVRGKLAHFEDIPEIVRCTGSLPAKVIVEDAASLQELIRGTGFEPDTGDPSGQALLREMKKRHGSNAAEGNAGA